MHTFNVHEFKVRPVIGMECGAAEICFFPMTYNQISTAAAAAANHARTGGRKRGYIDRWRQRGRV